MCEQLESLLDSASETVSELIKQIKPGGNKNRTETQIDDVKLISIVVIKCLFQWLKLFYAGSPI